MTRIRDPIHNYIHVDAMGEDLIDAPRVQRLRRIHQLGTGSLVYPAAHYTGVNIGVDLQRLVSDLALPPDGLAVKEGSVHAAEMLLVTRVQMYATVYFHRTLRVAERMIERGFRLALEAGEIKPEQLPQ